MSNRPWLAFKLVLSVALVAAPLALFALAPRALTDPVAIGIAALLLFFAALPWVNFTRPNRALALVGIVFALGIALGAGRTAPGFVQLPQQCAGRRVALCELENLLFAVGGEYLAAAPFALVAAFLLVGSMRMFCRGLRTL